MSEGERANEWRTRRERGARGFYVAAASTAAPQRLAFVRSFFVSLHRHVRGASLKLRTSAFATTLDGDKRGSFTSDSEP